MFSNAAFFRFTKSFHPDPVELNKRLVECAFKPCGTMEMSRHGWVDPFSGEPAEEMLFQSGYRILMALKHEERVIPPKALKQAVDKKADEIERIEGRKVRRREKVELKENIFSQMLPHAPCQHQVTYGYLDLYDGCLIVDASSQKRAEEFASALRQTIGSLPVRPPVVEVSPSFTMTQWLDSGETPDLIGLGYECQLISPSEEGGRVTIKDLDLDSDEVRTHLASGMQVSRLALEWDGHISFMVDDSLHIRRLKYGEAIMEKLEEIDSDDKRAQFEAMFWLASTEISRIFNALFQASGGEDRSGIVSSQKEGAQ